MLRRGSTGKNSVAGDDGHEEMNIASAEDQAVWTTKFAVSLFMVFCTVGVALLVFFVTRDGETKDFEGDVEQFSSQVFEAVGRSVDATLGALDTFVVSTVSFAEYANMTWPFVVLPHVGTRLAKVRGSTGSIYTMIAPIVTAETEDDWNVWSMEQGPYWVNENLRVQATDPAFEGALLEEYMVSPMFDSEGLATNQSYYLPEWQGYPSANLLMSPFNYNFLDFKDSSSFPWERKAFLSDIRNSPGSEQVVAWIANYIASDQDPTEPMSLWHYPIFDDVADDVLVSEDSQPAGAMVGVLWAAFFWRQMFVDILPPGVDGLHVVIENACNQTATYTINGPEVVFQGYGDYHQTSYEGLGRTWQFEDLKSHSEGVHMYTGFPAADEDCPYTIRTYPTSVFEDRYTSSNPLIYTLATVAVFVFTSAVFGFYDFIVEKRQAQVISTAVKASAIVSSLFPSNVRGRLFNMGDRRETNNHETILSQRGKLRKFVNDAPTETQGKSGATDVKANPEEDRPIADLFPEATVMFGDIAGFTAWSSQREPSQVFILLETLYGEFDRLATKRGVFKVETIGDCYVAVVGLPDPRDDHAIVMTKFANNCTTQMVRLLAKLSVKLGPDTEDLSMRIGLNSGPVTAGVLRGQKSRFQLFGDTVNTAARMESLGQKNRIHVSQSTADELIKRGKSHWVKPRKDMVEAKGKGKMATYWVLPYERATSIERSDDSSTGMDTQLAPVAFKPQVAPVLDDVKVERLVAWNVDVLSRLIRGIIAHNSSNRKGLLKVLGDTMHRDVGTSPILSSGSVPLDEVKEIISLPAYDPTHGPDDISWVTLDSNVISQLRKFVSAIARTYHGSQNPFHNFEHASHVCMSVSKLMSRIVSAEHFLEQEKPIDAAVGSNSMELFKHERTFGITSDPLTLFACGFSALIHDVDHPGVPNAQLAKEGHQFAQKYGNRSMAEQRSVDLAWTMLMQDEFQQLRDSICPNADDLKRFRQLVVNSVLATDIMDPELKKLRNNRWDKAFHGGCDDDSIEVPPGGRKSLVERRHEANRKATIVIEHLLQASDVAHTMQHWHIYIKWNKRLFAEIHQAYVNGRAAKHPAEFWYQAEMGFFDNYIIPLARKLSECGVFGVSSDEYLNYAMKNREEWERKGKDVVAEMVEELEGPSGSSQ
eukprot:Nitzschia sp. Nitz4//scaffold172_size47551//27808//31430//NITZ4_007145-RA/size47551-augustus-gene-0.38-mRNA-1//1//CDS//3329538762//3031//frame0